MKLLLVDVSNDLTIPNEDLSNLVGPPLGLLMLSAYLRSRFAQEELAIKVLDMTFSPADYRALRETLAGFSPDIVGIRALSFRGAQLHQAARITREWNPSAFIIAGGPYAFAEPETIMKDGNIDAACPGEGEYVLRDLLDVFRAQGTPGSQAWLRGDRQALGAVRGLHWRDPLDPGTVRKNPPMPLIEDLDELPFTDFTEIDMEPYLGRNCLRFIGRPFIQVMSSRGCPFKCVYCHSIFGRRTRQRSPANVAAELRQAHDQHGISDIMFLDDIFNINLRHAKAVLREIIALDRKYRIFFSSMRGDIFDEEFADLMAEAGVVEVTYAVESASPRVQKLIDKRLDIPAVERAITETGRRGIIVNAFFMLGFPGETEEELRTTVDFITRHAGDIDFPYTNIVRAYPGTGIYKVARDLGYSEAFLEEHARLGWSNHQAFELERNFLPNQLLHQARTLVGFAVASSGRMSRSLAKMRRVLSEDEIVTRIAAYFRWSRERAATFVQSRVPQRQEPKTSLSV